MKKKKTVARDIMTRELVVGSERITIEEAIKILVNNRITGFPIVDGDKKLIGVLSELDIIKAAKDADDPARLNMKKLLRYRKKVKTIQEDTPFQDILKAFLERKVRRLPVLNQQGHLTGIISRRDIMRVLFYSSKAP